MAKTPEPVTDVEVDWPSGGTFTVGLIMRSKVVQRTRRVAMAVPVYDERYQKVIANLFKREVNDGFDCIVQYTGLRRTGKTTLASTIAREIDAKIPVGNITFEIEDFNKVISENPYADPEKGVYPQAILDEAGFDLFSQNWQERIQRNFVRKFEVIGIKRQIIHFVLPHRKKLNKSIREEMVKYWINVGTIYRRRGLAILRMAQPNEWAEEVFWYPIAGFTFKAMDNDAWWQDYSIKKVAFVDKVAAEDPTEFTGRANKQMLQRNQAIRELYRETKMPYSMIGNRIGMSAGQVHAVVNSKDRADRLS